MRQILVIFFGIILSFNSAFAQESDMDFHDRYLADLFKMFYTVDSEIAYCMSPIIESRLISNLNDSADFHNPYKKLSKYVTISRSEDSLVKLLSWDRISGGSWHDYASYVQFKTKSGEVKYQRLDSGNETETGEPTSVLVYKVHTFNVKGDSHYMVMGYGTYGSGKQHVLVRMYKINDDKFVLCEKVFGDEKYLYVGSNRVDKINLEFNPEAEELSYNYYEFDGDIGFYKREPIRVTWVFDDGKFIKIKR